MRGLMNVRGFVPVLLVAFLVSTLPSASAAPPGLVVHEEVGLFHVRVAWTPADPAPEAYRVYGLDAHGASTLLAETANLSETVPRGFANYAVSSVVQGEESAARPSATGRCVVVDPNAMPPVQVIECPPPATTAISLPIGSLSSWLMDVFGA